MSVINVMITPGRHSMLATAPHGYRRRQPGHPGWRRGLAVRGWLHAMGALELILLIGVAVLAGEVAARRFRLPHCPAPPLPWASRT